MSAARKKKLPPDIAECVVCGAQFRHPAPGTGGTWRCGKPACLFGRAKDTSR